MPSTIRLLSTTEVAAALGVSAARVRQFKREGRLVPAQQVGPIFLYDPATVRAFKRKPRPNGGDRVSSKARRTALHRGLRCSACSTVWSEAHGRKACPNCGAVIGQVPV